MRNQFIRNVLKTFAFILLLILASCQQQKIEWVSTTPEEQWVENEGLSTITSRNSDVEVFTEKELQSIEGFGSCFNELGWTSLSLLTEEQRENVMKELFLPGKGANFTICRMPVAANDFALNWYSYNETDGDFEMNNFSIDNDKKTLIPFINNAKEYNPKIKIWASPWSPPSWMKYNKHYASRSSKRIAENRMKSLKQKHPDLSESEIMDTYKIMFAPKYQNDLEPDNEGREGTDMFIQEDKYLKAYALYFTKFIDEYRKEGIDIFAVMPQNEFNSDQVFPSCCWTASGLENFIGSYLGPAMEKLGVDIYFGTMERPAEELVDTILLGEKSGKYVKGIGFQWAGKKALPGINKRYPELTLYQTEQECGDGKNDWKGAMYSWDLMKHYLNHGVSVYEYWNTSLLEGGISRWGWAQNSLVVVDTDKKDYRFTYEYYVMKHASHYVLPGAKKLETTGAYKDILAFKNPDGSVIIIVANQNDENRNIAIKIGEHTISPELKANSINTFKVTL